MAVTHELFCYDDRFGSNCGISNALFPNFGLEQNFPGLVDPKEAVIVAMIHFFHTEGPLL
jgi:hypothetical protein